MKEFHPDMCVFDNGGNLDGMIMHQGGAGTQSKGTKAQYFSMPEFSRLVAQDRVQFWQNVPVSSDSAYPHVRYTDEEIKKYKIARKNLDLTLDSEYVENDARVYNTLLYGPLATPYTLSVSALFAGQMLGTTVIWMAVYRYAPFTAEDIKLMKQYTNSRVRLCDNLYLISGMESNLDLWLQLYGYSWSINTQTMEFLDSIYYKKMPLGFKPASPDMIGYLSSVLKALSAASISGRVSV